MKYATIKQGDNGLAGGSLAGGSLAGGSLAGVVEGEFFRPFTPALRDIAEAIPIVLAGKAEFGDPVKLSEVSLRAPILNPPHNILCVGKNYRAHAEEFSKSGFDAGSSAQDAIPQHPIVFTKPSSSISGLDDDIPLFAGLDEAVDYEAELAVVIGKGGRAISRDAAMTHVFGYTLVNDVTARDLQQRHKQWFLGKGIDGFCPMGPYIIRADTVDYRDLRISCSVNGEVRQNASLRDLIFDIPFLIETISKTMTLAPGDIIATGTPEGVGIGFNPPKFLADGDTVICEIPEIGKLRNMVRRAGP